MSAPVPARSAIRRSTTLMLAAFLVLPGILTAGRVGAATTRSRVEAALEAGRYAEAEQGARKLLAETEHRSGTGSLETGEALDLLAVSLRRVGKGREPEARQACDRALEIKRALLGEESAGYASSLYNLALLHSALGDVRSAEALMRQTLRIRQSVLGPRHPDLAASLFSLGVMEVGQVAYDSAQVHMERSLEIRESAHGSDHPSVAECLNGLGFIAYSLGDFPTAGACYERALAIWESSLGQDHPLVASACFNLAGLYAELGDATEALPLDERALRIRRTRLGSGHALTTESLVAVADDRFRIRDLEGSRRNYAEALKAQRGAGATGTSVYARTMALLGRVLLWERNPAGARPLLEEALRLQEATLGLEHPDLAWTLLSIAELRTAEGSRSLAWSAHQRALEILTRAYGDNHPDVAVTMARAGLFLAETGDSAGALEPCLRAAAMGREHVGRTARGLAERQALHYSSSRGLGLDLALALVTSSAAREEHVLRAWNSLVRSRALVLDEMAYRRKSHEADADSSVIRSRRTFERTRQRLSNLLVRGVSDGSFAEYREDVERLRRLLESQERELARKSSAFRESRRRDEIDLRGVIASLPEGSGLVAYAVCGGARKRYVAFVISADRKIHAVPIGDRTRVDDMVRAWRREVATPPETRASSARRAPGEDLRRSVWDPVAARLGDAAPIYVVPDGSLLLVNFDALPLDARYLVETDIDLRYLTTERDLVMRSNGAPIGAGLLALGGVTFDRAMRAGASNRGARRGVDRDCPDLATLSFTPLPETAREVEAIAASWPRSEACSLLVGAAATEAAFKTHAGGNRVIHMATHGFFLGEGCGPEVEGGRGIGATVSPGAQVQRRRQVVERNPLLLSGLALAGANRRASVGPGEEDGILTCDEVAALDLSRVEWAVLSACDTGLGRIQAGEGVLGLRRAFRVAGVRCLVMSLWAVEDRATRDWMKAFYGAVVSEGHHAEEAVRKASRDVLGHRRARGESTHPFYWAAFVAFGDGR